MATLCNVPSSFASTPTFTEPLPTSLRMTKVEMYAAPWCPYCVRAKALLDAKGVDYSYVDVDETPGAREEMQARGGGRTIPQIFIAGSPIGGCDELHALERQGQLDRLLTNAA